MSRISQWAGGQKDTALVFLVLGVLVVLFAPVPSGLLDFLILANFSFAFLILLLTFYMARPVEFSTFPSLLLIATLFRLSLNVAATRLILSVGNAGQVINAIGSFVVGGNYVIGLIVFLILIVVQYVVVTNGAQRVSEVAARFTLDSMPGQQMSIDADLNMGFIDQVEAQRRRKNLEKEAGFYGAMDGASKFVKGDAIAGIVIMLINIIGGLIIGVMQRGLSWNEALHTYTLLTIGDGIVTQVPALVIAVGTGIIVTRSASDSNLSQEVIKQITSFPKTLFLVGLALLGLLLLPGTPIMPTILLAGVFTGISLLLFRRQSEPINVSSDSAADAEGEVSEHNSTLSDPYAQLHLNPIEVHMGSEWAEFINQGNPLDERIAQFRHQYSLDYGMVLPKVRFKSMQRLAPNRYDILIDGVVMSMAETRTNRILAIHPTGDVKSIPGEVTRDPTYGLPAVWIEEKDKERAQQLKYTLVDPVTVLMTQLTETLRRESAVLLSRAEVERMLDRVRRTQAGLVEDLVPTVLSYGDVQKVLQNLLKEKVSVRNLEAILETLNDAGRSTKDVALLTELVRQRLGPAICQQLLGDGNALQVLTLEPSLEADFLTRLQADAMSSTGKALVLDPVATEQLLGRLVQHAEKMMKSNLLPVLLCAPELRRHIRVLAGRVIPHLRVLSLAEIPSHIELKCFSVVKP